MSYSQFHLKRLRVMQGGDPVYDQGFHTGVNIIRGENGSGKSTIADFIFYVLGGEFDNWKSVAANCDEVQAEIGTASGVLTVRRPIGKAQTPAMVFFGTFEEAAAQGLDGWLSYSIRRTAGGNESFSQIMFRASGIPEAQSQGAANITMNQLLRLVYADQRTPASFLFRYESFDTGEIREAVGDLVCGIRSYESYEIELELRKLNKQFDDLDAQYKALLKSLPEEEALARVESIDGRLKKLEAEYGRLSEEIANVDEMIDDEEVKDFLAESKKAAAGIRKFRDRIAELEQQIHTNDLEVTDLTNFIAHLEELSEKLPKAQRSSEIIGSIEFTHCPACLAPLNGTSDPDHCVLCGSDTDPEQERSRYLQIKLDLDIQIRESRQLLDDKEAGTAHAKKELRRLRSDYQEQLSEFTVRYEISSGPRESFVAERYQRLGQIDRELTQLSRLRERAGELEDVSARKAAVQAEIDKKKDRQKALETASARRRWIALTNVSEKAKTFLRQDLDRQDEFRHADSVEVNFRDNSILVDGDLNFAESSNVIVKNSVILALFAAATEDEEFLHPRFLLMDNIEDKGMEDKRSHNFQDIIVKASEAAKFDHQIIFTTSTINPELDDDKLTIGPQYTHQRRTLGDVN
ncbi:AAA family ATPase [Paenirhodobacter sp. CAU 1674]|uniref:AAA family ATPase n=1 Tax=Paenirhodobacter sp. CAU 1674 TaxID=3032596 RepID=UPI0023DBDE2B|nr:AAA family ATPase [Paenirhodobacter sp. CAU 1674]MDF2141494.1 AAA family ATPase [Paenirhodobacter sp. CAU 1674]